MHERHFDEQGVLTYHHKWLILINGSKNFDYLEMFVGNITNLSFLVWQKEANVSILRKDPTDLDSTLSNKKE